MVWNNSHNIKVVSESEYEAMKSVVPKCTALIHQCNAGTSVINSFACQSAFVMCNVGLTSPYQATGSIPTISARNASIRLCAMISHLLETFSTWNQPRKLLVSMKITHTTGSLATLELMLSSTLIG